MEEDVDEPVDWSFLHVSVVEEVESMPEQNKFVCNIWDKFFSRKRYLTRHLKSLLLYHVYIGLEEL